MMMLVLRLVQFLAFTCVLFSSGLGLRFQCLHELCLRSVAAWYGRRSGRGFDKKLMESPRIMGSRVFLTQVDASIGRLHGARDQDLCSPSRSQTMW